MAKTLGCDPEDEVSIASHLIMKNNLPYCEQDALRNFYNSVVDRLRECQGVTCLDKIDNLIELAKENSRLRAAIRAKNRELENLSNAMAAARQPIVVHDSTKI